MKKTIAALFMAGIFSLPAMAQEKQERTPEQKATMMTEKMAENLELTDDQKKSVYQANLEMANTMKDNKATARAAHQAKMKEILTDEQYAKMEQMKKQHKKDGKHKHMKSSDYKETKPAKDSDQLQQDK